MVNINEAISMLHTPEKIVKVSTKNRFPLVIAPPPGEQQQKDLLDKRKANPEAYDA